MDHVQSVFQAILFPEKCPPPNTGANDAAVLVHDAFWSDAHNRNLRADHVEVEVRLGRAPPSGRGPFDTNVPERLFGLMMRGLQDYPDWAHVEHKRDVVCYFATRDESVRLIVGDDGASRLYSKQKVLTADFLGTGMPFDFRVAVNIELPMPLSRTYSIDTATATAIRDRSSFTIGAYRYDLSRLRHASGGVEHQVEIELVDPVDAQLTQKNAQALTMELQARITALLDLCEPIRSFDVRLLRRRYF